MSLLKSAVQANIRLIQETFLHWQMGGIYTTISKKMSKANSCFPQQLISKNLCQLCFLVSKHKRFLHFYYSSSNCIHGTGRIPSMTSTASAALASWKINETKRCFAWSKRTTCFTNFRKMRKNTRRIFGDSRTQVLAFHYSQQVCKK